jgi:hypothetical protein
MKSKRLLVEEVAPLLEGHFNNDDLPDGAWFQVMVDTVEMHFANRRIKLEVDAHEIVLEFIKGKQK